MPYYGSDLEALVKDGRATHCISTLFNSTASAVEHVHAKGFVHGDIKPANFLIASGVPRLCDFEFVSNLGVPQASATRVGGTDGFLAPELCISSDGRLVRDLGQLPSRASDVFALGCTWQFINKGCRSLFKAALIENMRHRKPDLRPSAKAIVAETPGSRMLEERAPDYWVDRFLSEPPQKYPSSSLTNEMVGALSAYCYACKLRAPRLKNVQVWRLENPLLWKAYQRCRTQMRETNAVYRTPACGDPGVRSAINFGRGSDDLNERWLWHGCNPVAAEEIRCMGFDGRLASLGGMYGAGTYFTRAVQYMRASGCCITSKACERFYCSCTPSVRYLLLCRVSVGHAFHPVETLKRERRPPRREDGSFFDSVVARAREANEGKQKHSEVVIFNGAQAYAEFLVKCDFEFDQV